MHIRRRLLVKLLLTCCLVGLGAVVFFRRRYSSCYTIDADAARTYCRGKKAVNLCSSQSVNASTFLFVLIFSTVHNGENREAVRSTWLRSGAQQSVVHRFAVGTKGLDDTVLHHQLQAEHQRHCDMILLPSLADHYSNLTAKLKQSLVWVDQHYCPLYLLKTDNDTFVMLQELEAELRSRAAPHTGLYWGYMKEKGIVWRWGVLREDKWFLSKYYLLYALGAGYVISGDLLHQLALSAHMLVEYVSEDVSMGVWLTPFVVERCHESKIKPYLSSHCENTDIITHFEELYCRCYTLELSGVQCS